MRWSGGDAGSRHGACSRTSGCPDYSSYYYSPCGRRDRGDDDGGVRHQDSPGETSPATARLPWPARRGRGRRGWGSSPSCTGPSSAPAGTTPPPWPAARAGGATRASNTAVPAPTSGAPSANTCIGPAAGPGTKSGSAAHGPAASTTCTTAAASAASPAKSSWPGVYCSPASGGKQTQLQPPPTNPDGGPALAPGSHHRGPVAAHEQLRQNPTKGRAALRGREAEHEAGRAVGHHQHLVPLGPAPAARGRCPAPRARARAALGQAEAHRPGLPTCRLPAWAAEAVQQRHLVAKPPWMPTRSSARPRQRPRGATGGATPTGARTRGTEGAAVASGGGGPHPPTGRQS